MVVATQPAESVSELACRRFDPRPGLSRIGGYVVAPPWALGRYAEMNATLLDLPPVTQMLPANDLWAERALDPAAFNAVRRRALLNGCKWDAQVGDTCTLAPFPLVMKRSVWKQLAAQAEALATEAAAAEREISRRPDLLARLGLPSALRQVLAQDAPLTPAAGRIIRFDFHLTTGGWRISEANSDVPGGFTEASHFTALMAEHFPDLTMAGNPGAIWTDALANAAGPGGNIALLAAPGFMEDQQVVSFLASCLQTRGCRPHLARPEQIFWQDGQARLATSGYAGPLDAIVRFYQAEWLARLPEATGWKCFFRNGRTPVTNPALAVISESKRFPLTWPDLTTALPTWRALLPETRHPREVPWGRSDDWLLKTAMCNTGDTVSHRAWMSSHDWLKTSLSARFFPENWVAQRRFESLPLATSMGSRHACIGIYTVNGKAAGAYARLSEKPVINYAAVDVALLLENYE